MRAAMIGLFLGISSSAHGADEPFGWDFCTAPDGGGGLNQCISHVRANCEVAPDLTLCISRHNDAWFAHDVNATLADAVREDTPTGRLSIESLSNAIDRASPIQSTCPGTDVDCQLAETIKRALGNHAMRLHQSDE